MMTDSHENEFLNNASCLDSLTNSKGYLSQCSIRIVKNKDADAIKQLCGRISEAVDLNDSKITQVAYALKNSLISYIGYKEIKKLCANEDSRNNCVEKSLEELMSDLHNLVGLNSVKEKVAELAAYQRVQKLRKETGLKPHKSTLHLAFLGNPGTGKTTVARIIGHIYKQLGILSKGHFIEVSRTDLIAGYQGQTALKVKEVIEKAKGGVLFIDEAYSITENEHSDSYGRECLTELTKALEDYREDLVVIVAGYTAPMQQFFDSNPGLKSRFNTFIDFEDYTKEELIDIIRTMAEGDDYSFNSDALEYLQTLFEKEFENTKENFSNGRLARNIYEKSIMNQALRLSSVTNPNIEQLKEIQLSDVKI